MKTTLIFVTLAAIVLTLIYGLTGCVGFVCITYSDSDQYAVGDAEITDMVENIEIDWPSGSVSIVPHSEHTVLISEETKDGISDDLRVHWWLEGTTLHVKFSASGASLRWFINTGHKKLTLTVPENLSFDDVIIRAASADIDANDLAAETLNVSTASGNMNISCMSDTIRLNSASGNIQLDQNDKAGEIGIDTASGKINASLSRVDTASFESASGEIQVTADSVDSLSVKSTSGAVFCDFAAVPSQCKIRAVSGKVTVNLPENPDFTANISTTSGDFDSDFALKKHGGTYICGDGSAAIDIETTSGNVSIRKK